MKNRLYTIYQRDGSVAFTLKAACVQFGDALVLFYGAEGVTAADVPADTPLVLIGCASTAQICGITSVPI